MRDPHIHVEKTPMPGFGNAEIRGLIVEALGVVPNLPKTVGTGCGRRRPMAMTSTVPERVTCLACREYARAEQLKWAEMADAAGSLPPIRGENRPRPDFAAIARRHRATAARYASP